MSLIARARRYLPLWRVDASAESVLQERERTTLATALLPDDATIGRLRQFSLDHGLRPVEGLVGEHRSRRRGSAPEFSDYSPYTPGDDVRRIDWNAYARFETLYVRESEITTELDLHLLLDTSASMDWTGAASRPTKMQMARQVAMTFGWIALGRSDRVTVAGVSTDLGESFGPVQGRGTVVAVARRLAGMTAAGSGAIAAAMGAYGRRPRSGLLIVLSDLVGVRGDALDAALTSLANQRWRVVLIRIEDDVEADPGRMVTDHDVFELEDPESGRRQRVNLHAGTVQRYRDGRAAWLAELDAVVRRHGVPMVLVTTGARIDPDVLLALEEAQVIVS